jgi:hypothetical protein
MAPIVTLEFMLEVLPTLANSDLLEVIEAASDILEEREQAEVGYGAAPAESSSRGGGWLELKTVNGCGPYVYRRWREGGRLRSEYVGKVREA